MHSGARGGLWSQWKADFNVGYSPERINPGDRERRFDNILKIVSADTPEALDIIDGTYRSVVQAGTHRAPSIRVAEFAKVLENAQRDVNIALIRGRPDLRPARRRHPGRAAGGRHQVEFPALSTGLVGGHCIGVDPFYIAHKAELVGYHPHVIQSGRRVNDSMGFYVANRVARSIMRSSGNGRPLVTLLGVTFKENVPDIRNTRVIDIVSELKDFGIWVLLHDPMADGDLLKQEYGLELTALADLRPADAVVLSVAHRSYRDGGWKLVRSLLKPAVASWPTFPPCSTARQHRPASRCGDCRSPRRGHQHEHEDIQVLMKRWWQRAFRVLQRLGLNVVPQHFYSGIPDIADLRAPDRSAPAAQHASASPPTIPIGRSLFWRRCSRLISIS